MSFRQDSGSAENKASEGIEEFESIRQDKFKWDEKTTGKSESTQTVIKDSAASSPAESNGTSSPGNELRVVESAPRQQSSADNLVINFDDKSPLPSKTSHGSRSDSSDLSDSLSPQSITSPPLGGKLEQVDKDNNSFLSEETSLRISASPPNTNNRIIGGTISGPSEAASLKTENPDMNVSKANLPAVTPALVVTTQSPGSSTVTMDIPRTPSLRTLNIPPGDPDIPIHPQDTNQPLAQNRADTLKTQTQSPVPSKNTDGNKSDVQMSSAQPKLDTQVARFLGPSPFSKPNAETKSPDNNDLSSTSNASAKTNTNPMLVALSNNSDSTTGNPIVRSGDLVQGQVPDAKTLKDRAIENYKSRKYDQAISDCRLYLANYTDDAENIRWRLGMALLESGKQDEASAEFTQLLGSPNQELRADAIYRLGLIDESKGDNGTAQSRWQRVIEQYPNTRAAAEAQKKLNR